MAVRQILHDLRAIFVPQFREISSCAKYRSVPDFALHRLTPPQPILTQNGSNDVHSRKDDTFAVNIATFHTPWSPGPLKGQNFANFWTWTLTLEVTERTPLILNRSPMKVAYWRGKVGVRNRNIYLNFTYGVHVTWYAHAQWRFSIVSMRTW